MLPELFCVISTKKLGLISWSLHYICTKSNLKSWFVSFYFSFLIPFCILIEWQRSGLYLRGGYNSIQSVPVMPTIPTSSVIPWWRLNSKVESCNILPICFMFSIYAIWNLHVCCVIQILMSLERLIIGLKKQVLQDIEDSKISRVQEWYQRLKKEIF